MHDHFNGNSACHHSVIIRDIHRVTSLWFGFFSGIMLLQFNLNVRNEIKNIRGKEKTRIYFLIVCFLRDEQITSKRKSKITRTRKKKTFFFFLKNSLTTRLPPSTAAEAKNKYNTIFCRSVGCYDDVMWSYIFITF